MMTTPDPQNPLEQALRLAARGPQGYPELFRQLLKSHLLILIPNAAADIDGLRSSSRLTVTLWKLGGEEVVPVFTSLNRAVESVAAIEDDTGTRCLAGFEGATLFRILHRSNVMVVINAGCESGEVHLGAAVIS